MIRKHEKPLEQVIRRYQETISFNQPKFNMKSLNETIYKKPHNNGPLFEALTSQYQIVIKNKIKINIKSTSDSYIGLKNQTSVTIF